MRLMGSEKPQSASDGLLAGVLLVLCVAAVAPCNVLAERKDLIANLPPSLKPWAKQLEQQHPADRTTAAFHLARSVHQCPQVEGLLVDTLGDHDIVPHWQHPRKPWVQRVTSPGREAARGLVRLRAKKSLLRTLGDGSKQARQNAAWALAELGETQAVPIMLKRIWNPGFIRALGRLNDGRAVEPLIDELASNRHFQAARALRKLAHLAEPELIDALTDDNATIRKRSAEILGRLEVQDAGSALIASAERGNCEAAEALLDLKPLDGAESMYRNKLGHDDWRWRRTALAGLIHTRATVETSKLEDLLNDPDNTVRGYAARAAGALGKESLRDALATQLEDDSVFARQEAIAALAVLGDARALPAIDQRISDGGKREKQQAVRWLAGIGNDKALARLAELLADDEARNAARSALIDADKPAIEVIRGWLIEMDDDDNLASRKRWRLAKTGCNILAEIGEPAVPALIDLLDHGWRLQLRAQNALTKITGQKYEGKWQESTPKWKKWWENNKSEYAQ